MSEVSNLLYTSAGGQRNVCTTDLRQAARWILQRAAQLQGLRTTQCLVQANKNTASVILTLMP